MNSTDNSSFHKGTQMNTTTPAGKRDSSALPRSMDSFLLKSLSRNSTQAEKSALLTLQLQNYVGATISSYFVRKPHSLLTGKTCTVTEVKDPGDGTVVWVTNILCDGDQKPLEVVIHVRDCLARMQRGKQFRHRRSDSCEMCEALVRVHH